MEIFPGHNPQVPNRTSTSVRGPFCTALHIVNTRRRGGYISRIVHKLRTVHVGNVMLSSGRSRPSTGLLHCQATTAASESTAGRDIVERRGGKCKNQKRMDSRTAFSIERLRQEYCIPTLIFLNIPK